MFKNSQLVRYSKYAIVDVSRSIEGDTLKPFTRESLETPLSCHALRASGFRNSPEGIFEAAQEVESEGIP